MKNVSTTLAIFLFRVNGFSTHCHHVPARRWQDINFFGSAIDVLARQSGYRTCPTRPDYAIHQFAIYQFEEQRAQLEGEIAGLQAEAERLAEVATELFGEVPL